MPVCLGFLSVFECSSHLVLAGTGNEVHQSISKADLKFVCQISRHHGFQKGFDEARLDRLLWIVSLMVSY